MGRAHARKYLPPRATPACMEPLVMSVGEGPMGWALMIPIPIRPPDGPGRLFLHP